MHKIIHGLIVLAFIAAPATMARAGELKLTLNNGIVTLIADEVPLSRILAEWARVGQTKVVNGEKLLGVVTLRLTDVPERKALDILLRSASGYMVGERQTPVAGASAFDRIMILPFSRPPAAPPVPAASAMPQTFTPPRPMMPQPQAMDDDEPVMPPGMGPQPAVQGNAPTLPGMPGAQPNPSSQQPVLTAPRPGQLPQPGPQQPVPFGSPAAPAVKPPGGGGGGA